MEQYKWVTNNMCEFFPCHQMDPQDDFFNCLFCYCPLYALGEDCGGQYFYSDKGIKNCSRCSIPHQRDGYDFIISQIKKVILLAEKK